MIKKAQLEDGRIIEYLPNMIGEGAMKEVYLSRDKKNALCFYKGNICKMDPLRRLRLQKILSEFNPTLSEKKMPIIGRKIFVGSPILSLNRNLA